MDKYAINHLTILGNQQYLGKFNKSSHWKTRLSVQFPELYENSPRCQVWWFETKEAPIEPLRRLSLAYSSMTFLLDYECQFDLTKGLILAQKGKLQQAHFNY
jgi:hypothetical protein